MRRTRSLRFCRLPLLARPPPPPRLIAQESETSRRNVQCIRLDMLSNIIESLNPASAQARAAIIDVAAQAPRIAAWDALDDADHRRLTAASAEARAIADILTRIGANFWAVVSLAVRATPINAIANDGLVAAWNAGGMWDC